MVPDNSVPDVLCEGSEKLPFKKIYLIVLYFPIRDFLIPENIYVLEINDCLTECGTKILSNCFSPASMVS